MKVLIRVFLFFFLGLVLLVALVWSQSVDPVPKPYLSKEHHFADTLAGTSYDLDSIKAIIGENKSLPRGFELAGAIAYSAYPELKDVAIDMELTDGGAPMESTFDIKSMWALRSARQYRILLNDAGNSYFEPILLRSLPMDAQVGILAHELGHVAYYHELNLLQIGKWGLCYWLDDGFRAAHERGTDLMPVYHGLGSQIYQYAFFVRRDPSCQDFYAREGWFMDRYYMTDSQLIEVWQLQNNRSVKRK